ncbi:MAG: outer membrane beta-barrel protein [Flammeovirgaceae bacterium]
MQLITSKTLLRFLGIMLIGITMISPKADAQYFELYSSYSGSNFSITGGLGTTALMADLATHDISKQLNGLHLNVGLDYRITNYISIRGEGTLSRLYLERTSNRGTTGNNPNLSTVSLSSKLLLVHDIISRTAIDRGQKNWNIYFLGGVGHILFTPKNADTGALLRDERPFSNYAKIATIFPIGSGIEFFPVSYIGIGLEWQYITTSTDLLDDVKPEVENNTANDSYFLLGAKIRYQIGGANSGGSVSGFNYSRYLKTKKRAKYK